VSALGIVNGHIRTFKVSLLLLVASPSYAPASVDRRLSLNTPKVIS